MSEDSKVHAKYSPSSAYRWLECEGSIALTDKRIKELGEPPESEAAKSGTHTHTAVEYAVKNRKEKNVQTFIQNTYGGEIAWRIEKVLWELKDRVKRGMTVLSESEADLRWIDPDFYGTADITIVEDFGRLTVIDYKDGIWPVDPKDNPQLIAYALAKAKEYDYNFTEVCLVVIQPKIEGQPVREWVTTIKNLKAWAQVFKIGIAATKKKDAPLKTGEHCHFCPAKIICPKQREDAFEKAGMDFDELDEGSVTLPAVVAKHLAPKNLGKTLDACDKIESWIGEIRKHAFQVLQKGGKVPGWKLVEKRPQRKWNDAAKVSKLAKKKFGDKAFSIPELLSPAQLEKVAGAKWVNNLASKVSSGLTMAPESDPRSEANSAQNDFDDDI